ncbi:ankyrin repeat domain-containing protein [Novosphingobium panipatense]|uniref:Ankyrin repeat-containing protein n=1 Tax=Novosphingobium panipatense TaxID=428991 RepID=A0ABY1PZD0_9SPHN|nr:ankyrin repeat domain-containing protein [Novosphingobium panipatense]SMP51617.1 Ankyrin repeat-containing protein [Novosphingobium panipatense]
MIGCSQKAPETNLTVEGAAVSQCGDRRADTGFLAALRKSDKSLRRKLAIGDANAVAEAHKALDRGDYRLIAATTPSGISTEAYGVQCRVLGGLSPWSVRAVAFVPDGKIDEGQMKPDDTVTGFGRRYNAAVLADPRYPYGDVCRAVDKAGPAPSLPESPDAGVEQPFGFAELGVARMEHGLGAAARRGSIRDIAVLLKRDPAALDRPDLFGLTPLAWAVAYHRWPAAQALLRAKASPTGGTCQTTIDRQSPLQIARIMRWYGVIRAMRPLVTEEEFASLRQKPRWDDASLIEFNHALTELKERYRTVLRGQRFSRHDLNFQVDEKGNTLECVMEPASGSPAFDRELCGLAVEIVRWAPARDAFGTRVPETAKLLVGFGGGN